MAMSAKNRRYYTAKTQWQAQEKVWRDEPQKRETPTKEEQRIKRQYKTLRSQWGKRDYQDFDFSFHWLNMARQWKRPIQEIKRTCAPNSPYTGNVHPSKKGQGQ